MCQVQDGSVHLRHNEVLDAKDLSKKWTLACQSVPGASARQISGVTCRIFTNQNAMPVCADLARHAG
jgi:hypothetical protein